ncbi:MAG TPA: DNA polymerase ligase N-terminal domain-containing protein [Tepidisphaeraceae bacterium]|jgi:bifunctional non-homologous end joining protein LigD
MPRAKSASASLKEYQAKRNFKKSPEPSGKGKPRRKGDAKPGEHFFCVQKHLASHLHYDFRLEHHGVLLSWAVPKGPSLNPKDKRLAMRVEDHPLDYGDFEGVIPEGYGAGIVMLWDRGTWTPEVDDVDAALEKGDLKFTLEGVKLKGSWVLVRTRGGPNARAGAGGESRSWLLIKHRDQWAGNVDVTKLDKSVKSFGDFEDILASDKPDVWESHRPAEGGEAGAMLKQVIEKAARIKSARADESPKRRRKPAVAKAGVSKEKTARRSVRR